MVRTRAHMIARDSPAYRGYVMRCAGADDRASDGLGRGYRDTEQGGSEQGNRAPGLGAESKVPIIAASSRLPSTMRSAWALRRSKNFPSWGMKRPSITVSCRVDLARPAMAPRMRQCGGAGAPDYGLSARVWADSPLCSACICCCRLRSFQSRNVQLAGGSAREHDAVIAACTLGRHHAVFDIAQYRRRIARLRITPAAAA